MSKQPRAEPTGALVPQIIDRADLVTISTEALRAELARGLAGTADHLYRLGLIWAELEQRGEDLSSLRHGLARNLPLIAAGRLAAEAVVSFAGRPLILRALEGVPLDRQRRLAAGEKIEVIDPTNPAVTERMTLALLPSAVVRVVFGDGDVRSPASQRLAFRPRRRRAAEAASYRYRPQYNQAEGTLSIGRMTVNLADVLDELAGREMPALIHAEEYLALKVRLAPDEMKRLLDAARRADLPEWEMVRKALRAFGLI